MHACTALIELGLVDGTKENVTLVADVRGAYQAAMLIVGAIDPFTEHRMIAESVGLHRVYLR